MSLFHDIFESDYVSNYIENNEKLNNYKDKYNKLFGGKKENINQTKDNENKEENNDDDKKLYSMLKKEEKDMSNNEKNDIVKKIYNLNENYPEILSDNELDNLKYHELEFFSSNSKSQNNNNFFSKIDKTQTIMGKYKFMQIITNITNDVNILNERKKIVEYLHKNKDELINIRNLISKLKDQEGTILWFFKETKEEMKNMYSMVYFNNFWNKWINYNENILNIFYYAKLFFIPIYGLFSPIIVLIMPYFILKYILKLKLPFKIYWKLIKKIYLSGGGIFTTMGKIMNLYNYSTRFNPNNQSGGAKSSYELLVEFSIKIINFIIKSKIMNIMYYAFTISSYIYGIYNTINYSYSYLKIINFLKKKIIGVSDWIVNAQKLFDKYKYFNCNEIKETFQNSINFLNNRNLSLLNHDVFKKMRYNKNDTYKMHINKILFGNKGIILKQFIMIKDNINDLKIYMDYIANIDVWSSVASLYVDNNNFSLPKFIDYEHSKSNQTKPIINIEEFSNLMIEDSVKNNIKLGGYSKNSKNNENNENKIDNPNNIIITGPNASGKSTFLKGLTECLILAQTICIVPASKLEFTPFKYINTYLNIPDCQGKESLFQAEMYRCYKQINLFEKLKKDEFVFTIMDEIFVSTNYYEGVSGAYAISEKMARFDNSICIISTHFPTLSEFCDKNKCYKNYHFSIDREAKTNKILKNYKIKLGKSKQHIALEMLENHGFSPDIIKDAKFMYNYLINKETKLNIEKNEKNEKKFKKK